MGAEPKKTTRRVAGILLACLLALCAACGFAQARAAFADQGSQLSAMATSKYTVTFHYLNGDATSAEEWYTSYKLAKGTSLASYANQTITYGHTVIDSDNEEYCVFVGWSTKKDDEPENAVAAASLPAVSGAADYYAVYRTVSVYASATVRFCDADGNEIGSAADVSPNMTIANAFKNSGATEPTSGEEHKVLDGWSADQTSTTCFDSDETCVAVYWYAAKEEEQQSAEGGEGEEEDDDTTLVLTLYPVFGMEKVTVQFYGHDTTSPAGKNEIDWGTSLNSNNLPTGFPEKPGKKILYNGHFFKYWASKDGKTVADMDAAIEANTDYYAQYGTISTSSVSGGKVSVANAYLVRTDMADATAEVSLDSASSVESKVSSKLSTKLKALQKKYKNKTFTYGSSYYTVEFTWTDKSNPSDTVKHTVTDGFGKVKLTLPVSTSYKYARVFWLNDDGEACVSAVKTVSNGTVTLSLANYTPGDDGKGNIAVLGYKATKKDSSSSSSNTSNSSSSSSSSSYTSGTTNTSTSSDDDGWEEDEDDPDASLIDDGSTTWGDGISWGDTWTPSETYGPSFPSGYEDDFTDDRTGNAVGVYILLLAGIGSLIGFVWWLARGRKGEEYEPALAGAAQESIHF